MNYNLKEAFEIAYDRDIYNQLVCRAVARSHQADWRRKRRLKEETDGPEACGRRRHWHQTSDKGTKTDILSTEHSETNFSEIWIKHIINKTHLKCCLKNIVHFIPT